MRWLNVTHNETGFVLVDIPMTHLENNKYVGVDGNFVFECYPVRNELFVFFYDGSSYFKKMDVSEKDSFLYHCDAQKCKFCDGTVTFNECQLSEDTVEKILEKYNEIRKNSSYIKAIDAGIKNALDAEELYYNVTNAELGYPDDTDIKIRKRNN